jgi:type I restriction enzyme R subunit
MGELFRRRDLPHWDLPGAIYFVTSCLEGSIPAQGRLDLKGYRSRLKQRPRRMGITDKAWNVHQWKLTFARCEHWLDHRPAVRHLMDARLATVVVDAMRHFDGERYDLLAYGIMPSHFHWVFRPLEAWTATLDKGRAPREAIMHSLKRYTARECNILLGRQGRFWQEESYDHCVCDFDELERIIAYIEGNPVRARLVDRPEQWLFSSACARVTGRLRDVVL